MSAYDDSEIARTAAVVITRARVLFRANIDNGRTTTVVAVAARGDEIR